MITADPDPAGHRMLLEWRPSDPRHTGVVVTRDSDGYPASPDATGPSGPGRRIADSADPDLAPQVLPDGRRRIIDDGLAAETVYYYRATPYVGGALVHDEDPTDRTAAMATGPYGYGDLLYELLPAVYRRYDETGALRRFLALPGGELDRIHSAVRSLGRLHDLRRVDGRLLPLLAQWLGWRSEAGDDLRRLRLELRDAVALYRATGTPAAVGAVAARAAGTVVRVREYRDSVLVTNQPPRPALWLASQEVGGSWSVGASPLSLDTGHGRAAVVVEPDGLLLAYAAGVPGHLRTKRWTEPDGWRASTPLDRPDGSSPAPDPVLAPALGTDGTLLRLFATAVDPRTGRSRVQHRSRRDGVWSPVETLAAGVDDEPERCCPALLVDPGNALWAFWLERTGPGPWALRYQRSTGDGWAPAPADAATAPAASPVHGDLAVALLPAQGTAPARILALWTRREPVPGAPGLTRRRVVARTAGLHDPAAPAWDDPVDLPAADDGASDREPSATTGVDHVWWSSTRGGVRGLWRARFGAGGWDTPERVAAGPPADHAPLAFTHRDRATVVFRSERPVVHASPTRNGFETVDDRYAGSTLAAGPPGESTRRLYAQGRWAANVVGVALAQADEEVPTGVGDRVRRAVREVLPVTDVLAAPVSAFVPGGEGDG